MAEQLTTVLTVKINGTERIIKSFDDAEKAAAELNAEIAKTSKGTREYVRLNQELDKVELGFKKAEKTGGKSTSVIGRGLSGISSGASSAAKGAAGLAKGLGAVGLAVNGILAIFNIVKSLATALINTAAVGDRVEQIFGGLANVATELTNRLALLVSGKFGEAFDDLGGAISRANKQGQVLTKATQELEDAQRSLRVEEAKSGEQVTRLLIQARDRTRTDAERIALLQEAGKVESRLQGQRVLLAERELRLTGAKALAAKGDKEATERQQEAEAKYYQVLADGVRLQETIEARTNAIREQQAADAAAAAQKRREALLKQLDEELAAFNARQDFNLALLEGQETTAAKLARIDIGLAKERERIRNDELKGIEANVNDVARIELTAARARQEVAVGAIRAIQTAEQQLSDFRSGQAKEAAQQEAEDLTLPIEQRIAALLRLQEIEVGLIEERRAAALSEAGLTRAQIDLINEQADAALTAATGTIDATEERLENLKGGLIARIFGIGDEAQIEQTKQALQQLAEFGGQLLSDLGAGIFEAQAARQEAQAAAFAEQVAAAEQASNDAASRTTELQNNLVNADISQRSRIIRLIKEQQQAQARADGEAAQARTREGQAKTKAVKAQRTADSVQALINAALGITQVFASTPPPASFILAAITAATTAAQVVAINSAPLPTFADGGFTGPGRGPIDGTGHRVAGITHANEYVVPQRVMRLPQATGAVNYLEGLRGFADGGFTSPQQAAPTSAPAIPQPAVMQTVQVELVLTEVATGLQRVALADRRARL